MSTLGERIAKKLQIKNGGNQSELARYVGVSSQAVQQWISGDTQPRDKRLEKIAEFLGTTAVALKYGEQHETHGTNFGPAPDLQGLVPQISWVQAGNWTEIVDNLAPGDAEDWLLCPAKHGPNTFAVRVEGKSMYNPDGDKSFDHGDIIFVDPDRPYNNGSMVVVRLDDEIKATFKRLHVDGDKTYLEALNPDWPNRIMEVTGPATICGVVFGKWVPL